ncbi:AarF/ABC1/UbiB kinase family protein [Deferribacterales bacterium Es71-Z0220]|uniref:ABC1 kinase family protein n=1 Tax=Deferrivibrio essentukiensis TaxID=2880922 RepID=UPI001F621CBC|nr:AarF/UbiB family protein [Deferrivibrio essentukiensis]MCB4205187.1 AarF/ABC1/UbiB kinase family protein [Deferrivibrio essentukiensis]
MNIRKKGSFLFLRPLPPQNFKKVIIDLGASFIKLAQVLATRADLFDESYINELKGLHDQLPPMSKDELELVFKSAFKTNPLVHFEFTPIASASIGQVHIGYLPNNLKVAVKLRRRGILEQVNADIRILNVFNRLFSPLFSQYTKNSIDAVLNEFSMMIRQETNLLQELHNLKKFSKMYKTSGIKFPTPIEELCSEDCIVMSYEEGFRFDDKEQLLKYNIDFRKIISRLVDFYTEQLLINGFFHADPHPGNLFINPQGELILLDFGMVKSISNDMRIAMIEVVKAANERDFKSFIAANKKLGIIGYDAPDELMIEFSEKMFEIFSNENLTSESMQRLAFKVLESARDLPFKLPSDAVYVLRVSAIIEGLGTSYIENFNGIKDILPILQKNLPRALGGSNAIIDFIANEIKTIPIDIKNLKEFLHKANTGELQINISNHQLEFLKKELKSYNDKNVKALALMGLGLFILIYDRDLSIYAFILVLLGAAKIFWR